MGISNSEIRTVRRRLSSFRKARREEALEIVRSLPDEDQATIVRSLFMVTIEKRNSASNRSICMMLAFGAPAFIGLMWLQAREMVSSEMTAVLTLFAALPLTILCGQAQARVYPKAALELLETVQSPSIIGPLLQCLTSAEISGKRHLRRALIRLLPTLQPAVYEQLSRPERMILYGMLSSGDNATQRIALDALVRNDDEAALPSIEHLLKRSLDPDIAQAAEAGRARLLEVRARNEVSATLLRASQEETQPDTLLRASMYAKVEHEEELLHPANRS